MFRALNTIRCKAAKFMRRLIARSSSPWLERSTPFSSKFGLDRGSAIDRYFMDLFLWSNKSLIRGAVLEVGDDQYTQKYGSEVSRCVVLNGAGRLSSEIYTGDLSNLKSMASIAGQFDCVIATNVLNFIFDFETAVKGLATLVKPNSAAVLVTVAGVSQISRFDYDRWGDYWRFNDMSIKRVFEKYFDCVEVAPYGNAPLAAAFIMGLAQEEIPGRLFEINDPDYQILIAVKASRPKAVS